MPIESRVLPDSTSFAFTADEWAKSRSLLDSEGDVTSTFPQVIGIPVGDVTMGTFSGGVILANRTIKQALQDLETGVVGRMFAANNLSDIPNRSAARTNLGLGSAATWNVGTSGANIPLMSTANSWTGLQTFGGSLAATGDITITGQSGGFGTLSFKSGANNRWIVFHDLTTSSFGINRYNDAGGFVDSPLLINRSTGVVSLSKALPVTSGGTGATTITDFKVALGINNVDNTADVNKPVTQPMQEALSAKFDKVGGTVVGSVLIVGDNQMILKSTAGENPSVIHRNDGTTYGIYVSDPSSGPTTTWNALRPFTMNVSTGRGAFGHGLDITGSLTVTSNGTAASFVGSSVTNGVSLRNNGGSASVQSTNVIDGLNELGIIGTTIGMVNRTDGSSAFTISVTPSGVRTSDRRTAVLNATSTSIQALVPIDGRAYPRKSDGNNLNVVLSTQSGQPTGLLGTNDGTNIYNYNPSNFSVNYATTSGRSTSSELVSTTLTGSNAANLAYAQIAGSDYFRIRVGGTATDAGYAEIATADNGNEPIYVRQYTGEFTTVTRTLTLLDASGNTQVPGALIWDGQSRGLQSPTSGNVYGNVNVSGVGRDGWSGYAINGWASFMANGSESGLYSQSSSQWLIRFDSARNAYFTANVSAYSDERLKQNKRKIDNVTSRREGMAKAAIMYEKDGITKIGFGAQTLEKAVPEVVTTDTDPLETKSVSYADMVAILAVDNQNLADTVKLLIDRVSELEKQLKG